MDWDSVCYFLIFLYLIVVWLDEKCPLDPEAKAALEVEKALPMSENNIEVEEEYSDTDSVVESVASRGSRLGTVMILFENKICSLFFKIFSAKHPPKTSPEEKL